MRSIPITARGAEKLRAELQRLRGVDRPSIIQAIKDAREKGDLTENAEYDAARERQGFVEGRIQELEGKLSALQIIDPATVDAAGRVVFGATVELEDQNSGDLRQVSDRWRRRSRHQGRVDFGVESDRARANRQERRRHCNGDSPGRRTRVFDRVGFVHLVFKSTLR